MLDIDLFEKSLKELKRLVSTNYVGDGDTYIMAISRKGPRLLERLFSDSLDNYQVVTEYALPFIFKQMALIPDSRYRIMIVDDAVYYGSTLESLYKQIIIYKKKYKITNLNVKAYTAIKAKEAKNIEGLEIYSFEEEEINAGYSHFFVKNVMARIRDLQTSMEVDYPNLCYQMSTPVNLEELYKALTDTVEYRNRVYKVSYKEGGSVNILLPKVHGAFFNKIRIFTKGNEMRVIAMTPRMITDSQERLENLFSHADTRVAEIWQEMLSQYLEPLPSYDDILRRGVKKVLVALANYLYSFNTILEHRESLEKVFVILFGDVQNCIVNRKDLNYLVGANGLSERLYCLITEMLKEKNTQFMEYRINLTKISQMQVFENYDFPTKEDRLNLEMHNFHMIKNSESLPQALSAIFFNQTLLIERLTRNDDANIHERLRFGYTFQSLSHLIEKYYRYDERANDELAMHAWIDKRIDLGCVVPQYVIDSTNSTWTRVFRPGENEDIVLSYMARWVLFVLNEIKGKRKKSISSEFFSGLLACLANDEARILQKELEINLQPEKNGYRFSLTFNDESGKSVDVLTYMKKMYILVEKDGVIEISGFLNDKDVIENTTLSKELLQSQKLLIGRILKEFDDFYIPSAMPYLIFNNYFRKQIDISLYNQTIQNCGKVVLGLLESLEIQINSKQEDVTFSKDLLSELNMAFNSTLQYAISLGYILMNDDIQNEEDNKEFLNLEVKTYQLNIVVNLLYRIYYSKELNSIIEIINRQKAFYEKMDAMAIWNLLVEMTNLKSLNKAYKERSFVFALRGFINLKVLK